MGDDHRKPDRYSAFARNWKLIGITSRKKWQKSSIQDKVLWRVLDRISRSKYGDAVIRNACYEAGLLDGDNLRSGDGTKTCLTTIELMCLLSGIHAELLTVRGETMLRLNACPYSDILTGLCSPDTICECHTRGMVHAIDSKSVLNRRRKMCAGDPYCEFVVE